MTVMETILNTAPGAIKNVTEFLIGDEKRAISTVGKALTGQKVSAGEWADTATTIGTDLLMLVPGGQVVKAAKYAAKGAQASAKAASAAHKVSKVNKPLEATNVLLKHQNAKERATMVKTAIKPQSHITRAGRAEKKATIARSARTIAGNNRAIAANKRTIESNIQKYNPQYYSDLAAVHYSRARKKARKVLKDPRIYPNITYGGLTNEWE